MFSREMVENYVLVVLRGTIAKWEEHAGRAQLLRGGVLVGLGNVGGCTLCHV